MANSPNPTDLTQRFALDVQGFDAMRRQAAASPREAAKTVGKQFDAMFAQMMLKSMRDATPQDGLFDSDTSKLYTSMLDQQLSQQMASHGIGVADALSKQLMRNLGGDGGDAGGMAATNALAQAMAQARASSADGRLGAAGASGAAGYSGASALTPPLKGNGSSPEADAFVDKVAGAAQAASAATGIPARFIVGQAALQSGWGKREIRGRDGASSYNVFGVKATKGWTGKTVSALTTDYATLLKSNPRYAGVLSAASTPEGFANGMQRAGYATDPHYAKKLMSILRRIG